jgi:uncharacterized protein (TIGR02246 family)
MARVLSVLNPTLNIALVEREALLCRAENSKNATMKIVMILTMLLAATISWAQSDAEEAAIRKILDEEVAAWNKGDADAYSRHFAPDGTFTNLLGMFFQGREAFRERHEQIFSGAYRGSTKQLDVVSLKFVRPDVAIVETLQTVTGFQKLLPGTSADAKGRLRTRLLQVLVKDGGAWKIAAYHNVDVKGGVAAPEPR